MTKLTISIALTLAIADYCGLAIAQTSTVRKDQVNVANPEATKVDNRWQEAPNPPPAATMPPAAGVGVGTAQPMSVAGATAPTPVPLQSSGSTAAADPAPPAAAATWGTPGHRVAASLPRYELPTGAAQARPVEEPAVPRTYEYRFTVTLDVVNFLWRSGNGYHLFSEDDRAWRMALGFGYDLVKLPEHWVIAIEAGYVGEPYHGIDASPSSGSFTGHLSASSLTAGGSIRWALTPWLAPYGRLGLLASRVSIDLDAQSLQGSDGTSSGSSWSMHKWTEGGLLGAGVMFSMSPENRVALGLLLEGGVWLQTSAAMQLRRDLPSGAIATTGARIGTLENTGPYLRIAGVLRF